MISESKGAPEKSTSPRSSVPLAASRQPHLSTSQKSATLPLSRGHVNVTAPKQPVVSTKSLPFASKPFGSQSKDAETPTTEKQTKSPVTSPRSPKSPKLAPAMAARQRQKHSTSSESPVVSPRSPPVSPRQRQKHSTSSESPQVSPRSPLNSPRKAESEKSSTDSEKSTPRTPPRVAPKPRRDKHPVDSVAKPNEPEMKQTVNDEVGPIETEIFASITGPKSDHVQAELTGPSIMPGSVMLDFVPKVDNNLGKVDVVEVTESQPVTDTKLEQESIAPVHESAVHIDVVDTVKTPDNLESKGDVIEIDLSVHSVVERGTESGKVETDTEVEPKVCEENNSVQQTKECDSVSDKKSKTPPPVSPKPKRKSITEESLSKPNEQIQEESIVPCETVKTETAIILAGNKTDNEQIETEPKAETKQDIHESATNKDYHFRAPEHIDDYVDVIETRQERSASVSSESSYDDFKQCDVQDESYLEDIVEENDTDTSAKYSELTQKEEIPVEQMEVYKSMAEHIVADVIETVKTMDLSESNTKSPEISVEIEHKDQVIDNDSSEIQINADDSPPPLPESDAPPLPLSPPPITDTISSSQFAELNSEQVNSQKETSSRGAETESKSQKDTEHENVSSTQSVDPSSLNPVEDIIEISHTSQVHASIPTVVVSVCPDVDTNVYDKNVIDDNTTVDSQEKIGLGTEELAEYSDDFDESSVASETEDTKDDGTQAEKSDSYFSAVSQLDENLDDQSIKTVISMYEDIGKSIDSNQNIETVSGNIKTLDSDENESVDTKSITSSDDVLSEGDIIENQENGVPRTETGNEQGISQGDSEKRKVNGFSRGDSGRPKDLRMDANSDKGDSPFSSDSAMSPARSGTPHSDDERVDVDRMIRCKFNSFDK